MSIVAPRSDSADPEDRDPNTTTPAAHDEATATPTSKPAQRKAGQTARRANGLTRRAKSASADSYFGDAAAVAPNPDWMNAFPSRQAHDRKEMGMCVPVVIWLTLIHVLALAGPFFFTWQGLVLAIGLHWLTGSLGVCLGYHRLLTHMGFQTYRPVRWFFALLGGLSGEGSSLSWVSDHRQHHAHSDQEGDPHSPGDGSWWSHMLWLGWTLHGDAAKKNIQRWAPDLLKDPGLVLLDRLFIATHVGLGLLLGGIGYWLGGWSMATSFVVWGMFVRLVAILHTTWLVNSATHMWGYRNYATTDQSRNLWWVALLSYGEGWHNNHHAYPRMAKHGHKWWEVDLTYRVIQLLQLVGLAWDVVDYRDQEEKAALEANRHVA